METYDLILVGAGLFSAVIAERALAHGKKVLVLERRNHIAGNIFTEEKDGIQIHVYGAHIFHTDNREVWDYINQFAEFNRYTNSPVANYKGQLYNLPFNMNTFNKIWPDVTTPHQAQARIIKQSSEVRCEPRNLEEQAISLIGRDIYEKLVKGYTEKQWGRACTELPPEIITRLPVRYTFDNNYFNDRFQGIPLGGYTQIAEKLFNGAEIKLNTDFLKNKYEYESLAPLVIYTGMIDEYFDYKLGTLEYRTLQFKTGKVGVENFQGNAVINYTEREIPFTRIIEHKHFDSTQKSPVSYITCEYPAEWEKGDEPYYPVNNVRNATLYKRYTELIEEQNEQNKKLENAKIIFGGRLGEYRYYDMDDTIAAALELSKKLFDDDDSGKDKLAHSS